jgi:hypothetical protein
VAINWHPMGELVELLEVAEKVLGHGDGRVAAEIGAAGARANIKGIFVRFAFYVARPEYMMKRLASLWRQFNDEGMMRVRLVEETHFVLDVIDVKTPNWLFCCTLTGWCREVSGAIGLVHPTAKHISCRGKGDAECVWEVKGVRRSNPPTAPESGSTTTSGGMTPSSGAVRTPPRSG